MFLAEFNSKVFYFDICYRQSFSSNVNVYSWIKIYKAKYIFIYAFKNIKYKKNLNLNKYVLKHILANIFVGFCVFLNIG